MSNSNEPSIWEVVGYVMLALTVVLLVFRFFKKRGETKKANRASQLASRYLAGEELTTEEKGELLSLLDYLTYDVRDIVLDKIDK